MKILISVLLIFLTVAPAFGACETACTKSGTTYTCTDASYDCINAAVGDSAAGDTIQITDTTGRTWASTLSITKGIRLLGPGSSSLTITGSVEDHMISYIPAAPANNDLFEIAGFTFDANSVSAGFYLENADINYPQTKIKIHDNQFLNLAADTESEINGFIFGVVYNNYFTGHTHTDHYGWTGSNTASGNAYYNALAALASAGGAYNLYFEDNTFDIDDTQCSIGFNGHAAYRYNTFVMDRISYPLSPWFDQHGLQGTTEGDHLAGYLGEFYGNTITKVQAGSACKMFDHRGGYQMSFYNQVVGDACNHTIRHEYAAVPNSVNHVRDSYSWSNYSNGSLTSASSTAYTGTAESGTESTITDNETNFGSGGCSRGWYSCGIHLTGGTGSPTWEAIASADGTTITLDGTWDGASPSSDTTYLVEMDCCDEIAENAQWWTQRSGTFDGTGATANGGGVGCGTLAARPATCTTGVGYWATEQSCSDLTGMVGKSPSTPISGTLYKCTSTNTWEVYYTPYQYPHPLRNAGARANFGSGSTHSWGSGATHTFQ